MEISLMLRPLYSGQIANGTNYLEDCVGQKGQLDVSGEEKNLYPCLRSKYRNNDVQTAVSRFASHLPRQEKKKTIK
jgi:hypothetical protein